MLQDDVLLILGLLSPPRCKSDASAPRTRWMGRSDRMKVTSYSSGKMYSRLPTIAQYSMSYDSKSHIRTITFNAIENVRVQKEQPETVQCRYDSLDTSLTTSVRNLTA